MAVLTPHSQQLSRPDNNAWLLLMAAGTVQSEKVTEGGAAQDNKQYLLSRQRNTHDGPPLSSARLYPKHMLS